VSDLVEAARFNYPYQAELFRIFLEQHGVEALVFDTGSAGYSDGAMVGVRVVVLDEDLEEARRLFREYER
jgi:ATP phosphoribosyltransferase regulatory subunit HisZ